MGQSADCEFVRLFERWIFKCFLREEGFFVEWRDGRCADALLGSRRGIAVSCPSSCLCGAAERTFQWSGMMPIGKTQFLQDIL